MSFSHRHLCSMKRKYRWVMKQMPLIVMFNWPTLKKLHAYYCAAVWELQDSKAQVTALQLIIGTLQRTRVFGVENRDTLTHKATGVSWDFLYWSSVVGILYSSYVVVEWPWISSWQLLRAVQYSAKLLKKPDQCRAVYACSHLFWVEDGGTTDGERYTQLESLLSWWG